MRKSDFNKTKTFVFMVTIIVGLYFAYTPKIPRNGFLALSEEKQHLLNLKTEKSDKIKDVRIFEVKVTKLNGLSVLIMKKKNIDNIFKEHFTEISYKKTVFFASKENKGIKNILIKNKEISIEFLADRWIGAYRNSAYEDLLVFTDEEIYNDIPLNVMYVGVYKLGKSYGANNGVIDMNNSKSVKNELEFQKIVQNKENKIRLLDTLSISN